jgi:23S rRNA (adenine2030-N6)-methyltransferase
MFSYRHAFHAGNHADVLKHMVMLQLLQYMGQKDAPYMVIDTHAGAGLYALDSGYAAKSAEYESGIARLWDKADLPAAVAEYRDAVRAFNPEGKLRYYPGSPFLADWILREQDRLRLFELHPSDSRILDDNFRQLEAQRPVSGRGKRVLIQKADGFAGLKALLPPPSRRALVLMDPPYEDKNDYRRVKEALDEALKRFPTGVYAIWYPILQRPETRQLPEKLKKLGADWLHVTLSVSGPAPDGLGLHSSGMLVLNPPWVLQDMLKEAMPYLVKALGKDNRAGFTLESGDGTVAKPRAARA